LVVSVPVPGPALDAVLFDRLDRVAHLGLTGMGISPRRGDRAMPEKGLDDVEEL
jgi:hypothetical protein